MPAGFSEHSDLWAMLPPGAACRSSRLHVEARGGDSATSVKPSTLAALPDVSPIGLP